MKKLTVKISKDKSRITYVSCGVTIKEMFMTNNAEYILPKPISDEAFYRLQSEKDLQFSSRVADDSCTVLTWEN